MGLNSATILTVPRTYILKYNTFFQWLVSLQLRTQLRLETEAVKKKSLRVSGLSFEVVPLSADTVTMGVALGSAPAQSRVLRSWMRADCGTCRGGLRLAWVTMAFLLGSAVGEATAERCGGAACSRRSRLLLINTTCDDGEAYDLDVGGCEPCPAGFVGRGGYCSRCKIESYQEQRGQTRCVSCPENSRRQSWEDSDSRLSCVCMPGFYSSERNRTAAFDSASWATPGVECLACPRGAICPGYGYAPYNERLQCPEQTRRPRGRRTRDLVERALEPERLHGLESDSRESARSGLERLHGLEPYSRESEPPRAIARRPRRMERSRRTITTGIRATRRGTTSAPATGAGAATGATKHSAVRSATTSGRASTRSSAARSPSSAPRATRWLLR